MVTKDQLLRMNGCGELHYTGKHFCYRTVGPRGGVKEFITHCRLSGQCKTWKRDPKRFHQPVKYGMYESYWIEEYNAEFFHHPEDCPLRIEDLAQQAVEFVNEEARCKKENC
jgi:hypothetical protein